MNNSKSKNRVKQKGGGLGTQFNIPYGDNIEDLTIKNKNFRQVLDTTPHLQLVVMSLLPEEDIGLEAHPYTTQFFRVEKGVGMAIVDGKEFPLNNGDVVVVPPGYEHNIINLSKKERLQLYTIYSPPQHPIGTIQNFKVHD